MPVKSDIEILPKMNLIDYLSNEMLSYPITDSLLSDDIWKKFELDFPELSGFDDIFEDTSMMDDYCSMFKDNCEIRNHDCMWAGHCASKEHPTDEPRFHMSCFVPVPPEPIVKPAPEVEIKQEPNIAPSTGQQSLLKPVVRAAAAMPQTPPMSDDEESKTKTISVMKLLNHAIEECDIDEDSDLCDYFEEKEIKEEVIEISEPVVEVVKPVKSHQYAAESDHSYHKGKGSSMQMAGFGIDTPSDSEEEIDVVNVNEKFQFNNRSVFSFPNNPSTRDRQQIQRRMATAISKKKMVTGLKTIMPVRKIVTPESSPIKKKSMDSRGVKRKQYRSTLNTPYKRKNYGHSSDSEPEPSEKRSLHNNMERQRRIDLRNAFEDLRVLVPEVSKKERAAKVVILREAAQYCDNLTNASTNHSKHLDDLKKQQEFLRRRVSQLRKNLAAKR